MAKNEKNSSQDNDILTIQKPIGFLDAKEETENFGARLTPVIKAALKAITEHTGHDYNRLFTEMSVLYIEEYNSKNKNNPIPVKIISNK